MAFQQEANILKVGVEDHTTALFVPGPSNTEDVQSGKITYQILMSNGEKRVRSDDLLERLQDDAEGLVHLSNLADLRNYITVRLNSEVLP